MNEPKFYKSDRIYHKLSGMSVEKIYAYDYCYGIEVSSIFDFDEDDIEGPEITESQYIRVKKLILAKLLNQ